MQHPHLTDTLRQCSLYSILGELLTSEEIPDGFYTLMQCALAACW